MIILCLLATEVVLLLKGGGNEVLCPKRRFAVLSSSASFHEHMVLPVTRLLSEKTQGFYG
jgi:hypothetical protein